MMPETASILVVEDEAVMLATLCGILEDAGYKVVGLERGADAFERIRTSPFNAVITDIRLPDVDGMEILELAREINPDMAVIIITGYASVETAVDAINQGAYAYFTKPINPDEMKTALANALKQQRLSTENKRLVESLQLEITERKRMEQALRESEEFSSSLLENSPTPILVVNQDTSIRYVNPALEELTGFTSAEITHRSSPAGEALPEEKWRAIVG